MANARAAAEMARGSWLAENQIRAYNPRKEALQCHGKELVRSNTPIQGKNRGLKAYGTSRLCFSLHAE
jgi:hypothetical protein